MSILKGINIMSKQKIIIATNNLHKRNKLLEIVDFYFTPILLKEKVDIIERGDSFLDIAENKAIDYSLKFKSLVIAMDGGAIIPALKSWNPLKTKRFAETDKERIEKILELMKDKKDRTLGWQEAISIANNGKLLFSSQARAVDGVMAKKFDNKFYKKGIWLCSITEFPQFDNKNFFELDQNEIEKVQDSWHKLKNDFRRFYKNEIKSKNVNL